MIDIADARELALGGLVPLGTEAVSLDAALGRALGREVVAGRPFPGTTNSAMDGWAVRHADLSVGASLRIVDRIPAGAVPTIPVASGEAARIYTGAPLPPGADTVVIQEDCDEVDGRVVVREVPGLRDNVRAQGSDTRVGQVLLSAGHELRPGDIAVLASQGFATVEVHQRVRVVIVPNGDEVVTIDVTPGVGQVPDTNAWMLQAQVTRAGGSARRLDPVPDRADVLERALRTAAAEADLVITTGGMSVGDYDHARDALGLDGDLAFYKVRMKPGKPLGVGRLGGVPVLGLPGNPLSAFVGFELFGRPMLRTLGGFSVVDRPRFHARLGRDVRRNRGRVDHLRSRLHVDDGGWVVTPGPRQGSGDMSSILWSDALAVIPSGTAPAREGELVEVVDLR
jgi:molybdopterin molybdotransferase